MRREVKRRAAVRGGLDNEVGDDGIDIEADGLVHRRLAEENPISRARAGQNGLGRR